MLSSFNTKDESNRQCSRQPQEENKQASREPQAVAVIFTISASLHGFLYCADPFKEIIVLGRQNKGDFLHRDCFWCLYVSLWQTIIMYCYHYKHRHVSQWQTILCNVTSIDRYVITSFPPKRSRYMCNFMPVVLRRSRLLLHACMLFYGARVCCFMPVVLRRSRLLLHSCSFTALASATSCL